MQRPPATAPRSSASFILKTKAPMSQATMRRHEADDERADEDGRERAAREIAFATPAPALRPSTAMKTLRPRSSSSWRAGSGNGPPSPG